MDRILETFLTAFGSFTDAPPNLNTFIGKSFGAKIGFLNCSKTVKYL
jgi:hypothetical protein